MTHSSWITRTLVAAMFVGSATGCAPNRASLPPEAAAAWAAVHCEKCDAHRVTVEVRHGIDKRGGQGRFAFARVTNLNPHAVALTVEFTPDEPPIQDSFYASEQRSLTLGGAGHDSATSVLMLRSSTVRAVFLERVERYD